MNAKLMEIFNSQELGNRIKTLEVELCHKELLNADLLEKNKLQESNIDKLLKHIEHLKEEIHALQELLQRKDNVPIH